MRKRCKRVIFVLMLGLIGCAPLAIEALAGPDFGAGAARHIAPGASLVEKTHGFHCRPVYGWDPRLGIYHVHRHEGICRNYQRCMRVMYRCNLVMGRGWESWDWERWGFDNWRFDKCMLDADCY